MTAAVLDRPGSLFGGSAAASPFGGGRLTLEERLSEELRAARTEAGASCPVCGARMTAAVGRDAACEGCGSRLS